jgi:hypothetical protein
MNFDVLVERLAGSKDPAGIELVADLKAGQVLPVSRGPGRESARSLGATFAIRAKTAAAAGIGTLGLEATVARLSSLIPEESILVFHFSGACRTFSVFVREVDEQVVGIVMVNRENLTGMNGGGHD